ncbi:diacylglycerol/lipid kinase family protein [Enterococcus sp. BWR-S5]|uniref:diacylglycerol/lipid kinase family protein n=1 Tax=Enterococcus sp. BWR-S5 TaxID=2787714 RepID=UPI0019217477|nr:diacylglycerol kinase family protein [Enterococcus sp. BWR-S5]MBL1225638.1 diacylglycerol kinase family lipid kinase [Enterococcus sp. BWR-S5]
MKKFMILFNGTSGNDEGQEIAERFKNYAEEKDSDLTCYLQEIGPDIDDQQAVEAARDKKIDSLIIIGGDGTINRMTAAFKDDLPKLTVGILPGGTVNNVAQALNIPTDFEKAADIILAGHTKGIDYGLIGEHSIVSTMTIGILADTAARITQKEKQKYGKLIFIRNFFKLLLKKKHYNLDITIDDKHWQGKTQLVALLMTNSVGGYRNFDALAKPDDGLFHLIILPHINSFRLIFYLPKVMMGKVNELPDIEYLTGAHVTIKNRKSEKVGTRVDGDPCDDLPVELVMVKRGLSVFAPQDAD